MVGGGPLLPEILGQPAPVAVGAKFEPIFASTASAITPSEKKSSINTNRKFTTRFPMSLR